LGKFSKNKKDPKMTTSIYGFDYKDMNKKLRKENRLSTTSTNMGKRDEKQLQRIQKQNKFLVAAAAILMPVAVLGVIVTTPAIRTFFSTMHLGYQIALLGIFGVLGWTFTDMLHLILKERTSPISTRIMALEDSITDSFFNKTALLLTLSDAKEGALKRKQARLAFYPQNIQEKLLAGTPLTAKEEIIRQSYARQLMEIVRYNSRNNLSTVLYRKEQRKEHLRQIMHGRIDSKLPKYING
jgi:hypothetical protein